MELKEIVLKLTGPIDPIGETRADDERFESLKVLCGLVDALVVEIDSVSNNNKNRHEYSRKRAGEYADKFLGETLGITE